jgi:hypothetical protein
LAPEPTGPQPVCAAVHRPERLFDPATTAEGLRAAQSRLSGADRTLGVWLYHDPPAELADPAPWSLTPAPGGAPVAVTAATIESAPTPHVELALAGEPDLARYRLGVDPPAGVEFDPLRTWLAVRLRPECPDLGPCTPAPAEEPAERPSPPHDYLARDWRSLRAALVELLLRERPDADLSAADPTIGLIELFAHVGDLLHYRLDRVATEAYLETARLRTSVRRHARLVDFTLAEAVSARTYVHVSVAPESGPIAVDAGEVAVDAPGSASAFTLDAGLTARDALGEIAIYDWGEDACCLRAGATECVLVRPTPADPLGAGWLAEGDLLLFEVVEAADAGAHARWSGRLQPWPVDAPAHGFRAPLASRTAQVVRLTGVEPYADPLLGAALELTLVRWSPEDALARPYPVAIDTGAGAAEVAVARANVVPAHHGRLVDGPAGTTLAPRPRAGGAPLEELVMVPAGAPAHPGRPGGPGLACNERGRPHGLALTVGLPSGVTAAADWVRTLLDPDALASDFAFVVDVEEHEPPVLRFRTGAVGRAPPLGSVVTGRYEVGGGSAGNVAANALTLLERNTSPPGQLPAWEAHADPVTGQPVAVRNPVPGRGGAERMTLEVARRDAPEAFAVDLRRAVLPADHAAAAGAEPLVQRATAERGWSGSWPVVTTVVDLAAQADDPRRAAIEELRSLLDGVRMIGTEAAVVEGAPVGVLLSLALCVAPGADPEAVRAAALRVLRPGSDIRPGLFHPSRLQLGAPIYVSAAVAAVAGLPGVDAVEPREARRLSDPPGTVRSVIAVAPDEVAVLDDDPARPERGRIDVVVRGGR